MFPFNRYKATPFLLEKITSLCGVLWQSKREHEQAAMIVSEEWSRTILLLAQESNQYACELSAQIQTLGGVAPKEIIFEPGMPLDTELLQNRKGIVLFCKMSEKKIMGAYYKLLNESGLYEGFRRMMRYQVRSLQSAFVQIKLLNALQFS